MKRPVLKAQKPKPVVNLMLDSGVFSAWNRGFELDIKDYIAWLKKYKHLFYSHVNMDKIPGLFGKARTREEVEDSASQSYKNQQKLKDAGLSPIPVFHQGERLHWLEQYLADGEPYIGLSTSKDVPLPVQQRWLDSLWGAYLSDKQGRPIVKTHGFGVTRASLLFGYPWFSVDSTTWSLSPGYGQILCPVYTKGKPDYLKPAMKVIMSGEKNESLSAQKKQFAALGEYSQSCVLQYLAEVGISLTEARYEGNKRRRVMLHYYRNLSAALHDVRYSGPRSVSFGPDVLVETKYWEHVGPWNLHMFMATALNPEWSSIMTEVGANLRLLNYFDLRDRSPDLIEEYVMTGRQGEPKRRPPAANYGEGYRNWRRMALYNRHLAYQNMKEEPTE